MFRLPLILVVLAGSLAAQSKALSQGAHRMEITLERRVGNAWRAVDPGFIFDHGDRVRFRYRTNFNGFLYVMNHGTGGAYLQLFPGEDTGLDNRVEAGKEYIVPATSGAFRVDGPPGHDLIYWMVSPVAMSSGAKRPALPQPPPPTPARNTLIPKCDDTILRARGECVDSSAGAQTVRDPGALPENFQPRGVALQQDLIIRKQQNAALVSSPSPLTGPVTFEFKLAHK